MKSWTIFCLLLCLVSLAKASKESKRCTWSLLRAVSACKNSCRVLGHSTGVCSPEDYCLCSGEDYDLLENVGDWFEEKLDLNEFTDRMDNLYEKVKQEVKDLSWLKDITLSRCKVGGEKFCRRACHSIGRVDGDLQC